MDDAEILPSVEEDMDALEEALPGPVLSSAEFSKLEKDVFLIMGEILLEMSFLKH